MEADNKSGKGRRGRCKKGKLPHKDPPQMFPAVGGAEKLYNIKNQALPVLHEACLYGQLDTIKLLVEFSRGCLHISDPQGHQPVHMVLSSRSAPNTSLCLKYLLEHGAKVNITTVSGTTPLHLAASEGLLECLELLVQAGADVLAQDNMGYTPLDLAYITCRREVARYLISCIWQIDKKKEMHQRKQVQALYSDLVDQARLNDVNEPLPDEKMAEWANSKGFPPLKDFTPRVLVSQYHTQCLPSDQNKHPEKHQEDRDRPTSSKQPPASSSSSSCSPWTIFAGLHPEEALTEPDLRDSVTVWRRGRSSSLPQYSTKWDSTPHPVANLPLEVIQRVLFPKAFPSRIALPRGFEPKDIVEVQHRGYPQGRSTSPWTEVAMHLAEQLEPGHF